MPNSPTNPSAIRQPNCPAAEGIASPTKAASLLMRRCRAHTTASNDPHAMRSTAAQMSKIRRAVCMEFKPRLALMNQARTIPLYQSEPHMTPAEIISLLETQFGSAIANKKADTLDPFVAVDPSKLVEVSKFLRDDPRLKFELLNDISGVDYLE